MGLRKRRAQKKSVVGVKKRRLLPSLKKQSVTQKAAAAHHAGPHEGGLSWQTSSRSEPQTMLSLRAQGRGSAAPKQKPLRSREVKPSSSGLHAKFTTLQYLRMTGRMAKLTLVSFWRKNRVASRLTALFLVFVIGFAIFYEMYDATVEVEQYDISGNVSRLLDRPLAQYADELEIDEQTGAILYNDGYDAKSGDVSGVSGAPKISARFGSSPDSIVSVTDPVNSVSVTFTPEFAVREPQKDQNRVLYPIVGYPATKVYTAQGTGIKEDIIFIEKPDVNEASFTYEVGLPDGLEMRLEHDGSLGVYGVQSSLLGNVATGSDEDADLLQKARQNAEKTQLLFKLPAPYVIEQRAKNLSDSVEAWFELDGSQLTLKAKGLQQGNYPLSIDPTIYVETARKLMRGNNESNIDFDVNNELIQKSQTTGARIDAWTPTGASLPLPLTRHGMAVAGGYIYSAGGISSNTASYASAGTYSYIVPAGVTSVTVKLWGGGGGGGGGGSNGGALGGDGGGGGYVASTLAVTPGETLDITVGAGGGNGDYSTGTANDPANYSGDGGGGGGRSFIQRSATSLAIAGGGGGGGGGDNSSGTDGGDGGAGGGATAQNGSPSSSAPAGNGGGSSCAGSLCNGGNGSENDGTDGASESGGLGADGATDNSGTDGSKDNGGLPNGGHGGNGDQDDPGFGGGGGGGDGYFGGGGGSSSIASNAGGGGGGGGSGYITGSSTSNTTGTGSSPGNSGDTDRSGAGDGGGGGPSAGSGVDGDDGLVQIEHSGGGTSTTDSVYWAQFNSATNLIESPTPSTTGIPCSGWCNESVYDLPSALRNLSLIAYNGYLYAIGGSNSSGTPQTTVYIAKLGANGEPSLWHPTGGTPDYWYTDTALSNARSEFSAVAYNNRIYLLGGLTTSSTVLGSNTVQMADIKPNGTLTTWTTTGTQALTTARYGVTAHVYNDTLYVLGGNATHTGTPVQTVEYSKLNSDGTMNPWVAANSMVTNGRMTGGGSFSTIFGGYMYINGGCGSVNGSGHCTDILNTVDTDVVQLASINADGSLGDWNEILNLDEDRYGHTMISWQGGLYQLGGCRTVNTGTGECTETVNDVDYGIINQSGEASTVATSVSSGTAPCSGGSPFGCDLPGTGNIGNLLASTVITNGYLYIIGGCTNSGCSTTSGNTAYTAIGSDGTLSRPATCVGGTFVDSYCVDSTNPITGGVAAAGTAVFNNRIYIYGGVNGSSLKNALYYVGVNNDGSLNGTWSTQALASGGGNIGTTSVSYAYTTTRANAASATTFPGNFYIFGGCTSTGGGIGCSSYTDTVYKCNIAPGGALSSCGIGGQLQIGTATDGDGTSATSAGIAAHAGAVYANYIYLVGGLAPNLADLPTSRYARFDDSNNVVAVSGGAWIETSLADGNLTNIGRRRGSGFGYNGYLYVAGGYDASTGELSAIEFAKIDVSDGSIGSWNPSSVEITPRWGLSVSVSNSYAFAVGGCDDGNSPTCNGGGPTDIVQTFQIYNNDSGAVADFTAQSDQTFSTDVDRWGASSAIKDGYIYVAGGCTTSACGSGNVTADVQYAAISATDGSIGSWAALADLPDERAWGFLGVVGGDLYYVGGEDDSDTAQDDVYYVTPQPGGGGGSGGQIEHYSARLAGEQTKTSSNVWANVVGGADSGTTGSTNGWVDSTNLTAGEEYLVMVWASHNTNDGNDRSGVRVNHGGTVFTESQAIEESDRSGASYKTPYFWFTVWEAAPGEDLEVEFFNVNDDADGNTTGRVEDVTMIVMNAEELIADGDLVYDIDTTGATGAGALDSTPTSKVSADFDAATSETWWTMGYVKGDIIGVNSDRLEFQLDIEGTEVSSASIEGEDANDNPLYGIGWVDQYTGIDQTASVEISESNTDQAWAAAGVFSLNIDRFQDYAESSTAGTGPNITTSYTEQAGIDPVIATASDVIVVAGSITDDNGRRVRHRLQSGASSITDQVGGWQVDPTDLVPATLADMQLNVSPSTPDFNYDAVYNSGSGTTNLEDRWILAFSTEQVATAGTWNTATNGLPDDRSRFGAAIWNDRIYVVGGLDSGGADSTTVYVSPQLSNGGDISSSWTTSTGFNVARSGAALTAYANNLYLFGGYDGANYLSDVQHASIGYKEGTITQSGTTITGVGTTFAPAMIGEQLQYRDGEVATIEGFTSATAITVSVDKDIASAEGYTILDGSVGEWTDSTRLPNAVSDAQAVSANGYIYLVGGRSAATTCRPITQIAPVSANTTIATGNDGTGVGEWFETNIRYGGGRYGVAVAYDGGKLYTMGGGCSTPITATYTTGTVTQSANTITGSGTSWTDDYVGSTISYSGFSGTVITVNSATSITVDTSNTQGSGVAYSIANTLHYGSTVKSQPQIAYYSRLIDTDTDVFPNSFLINGLDNSIGARWQVRYRSMHDINPTLGGSDSVLTTPPSTYTLQQNPNEDCGTSLTMPVMTTWGRETDFGDTTLGDVSAYTALNDSGGDINCARYFYFFISIDASQTFGYPEDVNRGPTLSDLSLFFTADPNKRLRHGKSFTGGEQQPLDTPCRQSVDADCPLP